MTWDPFWTDPIQIRQQHLSSHRLGSARLRPNKPRWDIATVKVRSLFCVGFRATLWGGALWGPDEREWFLPGDWITWRLMVRRGLAQEIISLTIFCAGRFMLVGPVPLSRYELRSRGSPYFLEYIEWRRANNYKQKYILHGRIFFFSF